MSKPKLRADTAIDLYGFVAEAVNRVLKDENAHPFKSCLNCRKFNEKQEVCNQYSQRPPARIIAFGCPSHDDMLEVQF